MEEDTLIHPLNGRILIQEIKPQESGGVILESWSKKSAQEGRVVAVGQTAEGEPIADVHVGDRIFMTKGYKELIVLAGQKFRLVEHKDIVGRVAA